MDEKRKSIEIQTNIDEITARIADTTHVTTDNEGAKILFVQNLVHHTDQESQCRCLGSVYLTWPHLIRLSGLLQRIIAENKEKVLDHYQQSFNSIGKVKNGKE